MRATEAFVRASRTRGRQKKGGETAQTTSPAIRDLEARLTRALGTKVLVRDHGNHGEIAIPYADLDALDRLSTSCLGLEGRARR